jgi:hypothetical protein
LTVTIINADQSALPSSINDRLVDLRRLISENQQTIIVFINENDIRQQRLQPELYNHLVSIDRIEMIIVSIDDYRSQTRKHYSPMMKNISLDRFE